MDLEKQWNDLRNDGKLLSYIEDKFDHYKELGYQVSAFISSSYISIGDESITGNKSMYHELKSIHDMDAYLKDKEESQP